MLRVPATRTPESESGSVALAVIVLMLSAAIAAATLSQAQLAIRSTSRIDDRSSAQAGAEQGVAEAIARLRLDQTLPFDGDDQNPTGTFKYAATQTSPTTVQIDASGTVNNATRSLQVLLEQTGGLGNGVAYTLFANSLIVSQSDFGYVEGRIGTNGTIQYNIAPPGDYQDIFTPFGSCPGCPRATEYEGPAPFLEPKMPTGPTRPCPDYHWFETVIDGQNGIPFACTGTSYVVLGPNLEVINPPLIIYADVDRTVYVYLTFANRGRPPSDLQVYALSSPGSTGLLNLLDSAVSMEIYAPGRATTPDNYRSSGMLVVDSIRLESQRGVFLYPDQYPREEKPPTWTIAEWRTANTS